MESVVMIAILISLLLAFFLFSTAQSTPTYTKKACKPHRWMYCDEDGWITESSENKEERLKHAILVCYNCRRRPQEDSGSSHGEY